MDKLSNLKSLVPEMKQLARLEDQIENKLRSAFDPNTATLEECKAALEIMRGCGWTSFRVEIIERIVDLGGKV